ncbi:hypothetical protein HELRODRAFT_178668 [Helobdella robusta]|uniref:DUF4371 domain-containing protein n=1 Tax=Helobdella robusta TaxID=6412 RepID=T1FDJ3_HELRO|nr:hypothetical protein HELRODRAFT_178668 [Helobdella robusta]ESN96868.1 hypothetical protein HELRODRAFT_178668 [Helobdella robusta]
MTFGNAGKERCMILLLSIVIKLKPPVIHSPSFLFNNCLYTVAQHYTESGTDEIYLQRIDLSKYPNDKSSLSTTSSSSNASHALPFQDIRADDYATNNRRMKLTSDNFNDRVDGDEDMDDVFDTTSDEEKKDRVVITYFHYKFDDNDHAFTRKGFNNWKHALDKFKAHEKSLSHQEAYLCKQGLAIWGKTDSTANFNNLLKIHCEDSKELSSWLKRSGYKWNSREIQIETIEMLAFSVLKIFISELFFFAPFYSIMIDESTDASTIVVIQKKKSKEYIFHFNIKNWGAGETNSPADGRDYCVENKIVGSASLE